jgi:hypothetical protein
MNVADAWPVSAVIFNPIKVIPAEPPVAFPIEDA